ncbi:MAG TPA: transporter substrate-binding domain-containing protein [Azospirillaceae bacterium]|nr:transporter substrate-binding domain-containing protein [Azospirillaceae bacterium]
MPSRRAGTIPFPRRPWWTGAPLAALLLVATLFAGMGRAEARDVVFGFRPVAPFVVEGPGGVVSGPEVEIVRAALAVKGHNVVPYLGPISRLNAAWRERQIDGYAPVIGDPGPDAWFTAPFLDYRNVAMTLSDRKLGLATPGDLAGLRVVAFKGATQALGPAFRQAAEAATYREEIRQHLQVLALLHERCDVIVADRMILRHQIALLEAKEGKRVAVTEHDLFPPTRYPAVFSDPQLAADFDEGLAEIARSGLLQRLLDQARGMPGPTP